MNASTNKMFTINFVSVICFIGALFLTETKQQSIVLPVNDCTTNTMCDSGYTLDLQSCLCTDTEPIVVDSNSNSKRNKRLSDKLLVSKLIRDDEFVMQASSSSKRCRNDEQWNGNECIPLISLCPGGYHWNGYACVIQVLTKTAALVPSGPDTKCALSAKINDQQSSKSHSHSNSDLNSIQSLPMTVMPTYSTSPMCPFGFIWSDDKCIRNPPTCPSEYVFHENLCHLRVSSTSETAETIRQPTFNDNLKERIWGTQPTSSDLKQSLEHEIENSAAESNTDNDQNHKHCCIIRSPRLCRRNINNRRKEQWQCYHHQYRRCADFCTKPNLYLRTKKTMFVEPLLIMPPPPRRLQKFMLNLPYRESNIGKQFNSTSTLDCLILFLL